MMENMRNTAEITSDSLATLIRQKRKQLNITQAEAAATANVSVRLIHELESGKLSVQTDKLLAVLNALGINLYVSEK